MVLTPVDFDTGDRHEFHNYTEVSVVKVACIGTIWPEAGRTWYFAPLGLDSGNHY